MWLYLFIVNVIKLKVAVFGILEYQNRKERLILYDGLGLVIVLICTILFPSADLTYLVSFLPVLIVALCFKFIKQSLVTLLIFLGISFCDAILECVVRLFEGNKSQQLIHDYKLIAIINLISLIMLAAIWYIKVIKNKKKTEKITFDKEIRIPTFIWYVICLISVILYVVPIQILSISEDNERLKPISLVSVTISGIAFFVISIYSLFVKSERRHYKLYSELNQKQLIQQKEYYENLLEKENETKKFRHDIKNNLQCIKYLQDAGKFKEAKEYLNELVESIEQQKMIQTGNMIFDIIIMDTMKKKVDLNIEGMFPEKIKLTNMEICIIFSNLLRNAVTAVEELSNESKRIDIIISCYEKNLFVKIQNPVDKKRIIVKNIPNSTKKDKRNHGIGSLNVREIVNKYNGDVAYFCTDEEFKVEVSLWNIIL